jgi:hypothetical protein
MSTLPEQDPLSPLAETPSREDALTHEEVLKAVHSLFPYDLPESAAPAQLSAPATPEEPPLFQAWSEPVPPPTRHPNFADVLLLGVLALVGFLAAILLSRSALYFHLWGISTTQKALNDVHYTIGSMAVLYLVTFGLALLIFPLLWQQGLFAGLHWNARGGRMLSAGHGR